MEFRILGPLEVADGDRRVALGGEKPRALLALLLLHVNEVVPSERLIEELWADATPEGAGKLLHVHVSRLRKALGAGQPLATRAGGYVVELEDGELDSLRFERQAVEGRRALAADEPADAAQKLSEALALWRGPPLVDFSYEPFAQGEIARLEELRVAALEDRIEADLALGRHAQLVGELESLVVEHPLRERLRGQLMRALYRCGRQADALEAYRHGRSRLVDELGLEPGPALHDLHQAILEQRADLPAPARTPRPVLPAPPNRTVGRDQDVGSVVALLRSGAARLVTLIGPGGVGKTRLALEVAGSMEADFADGARFVSLAAVSRSEDVPTSLVKALEIVLLSGESADRAVTRFLAGKHLLLVVDNCEHVLAAAPFIGGLPGACPGVTVLATSREPLAVQAEQRYPVSTLADADAAVLFSERARAHDPTFVIDDGNAAAIAEICERVDRLPLAIELAAARCSLLSPAEIASRLRSAISALGPGPRDAPARQRTLRATIDWSHELLDEDEQRCLARFAVFRGGATLPAAESVTGAGLDTLDRLVAKSLLVRRRSGHAPTRLRMLETIREYAAERLASSPDEPLVRERHYREFLALAQQHGSPQAIWGTSRKQHLAALDDDVDNVLAGLAWAAGRENARPLLELSAAVGWYLVGRDRYADAVTWIDRALGKRAEDADLTFRIRALCIKGVALFPMGRRREQRAAHAEAEALARALAEPAILSHVLQIRASEELGEDRPDLSERLADEAHDLASAAGDKWAVAMAAFVKGMAAPGPAELRARVDRASALLEEVGNVFNHADLLASAAFGALCIGSDADANDFLARAVPLARTLDSPYLWMLLSGNVGLAALLTGDTPGAREAFREELRICRELVALPFGCEGMLGLAAVAVGDGNLDRAARLCGAADAHRYGLPEDPVEARLRATFLDEARRRHGTATWDAAAAEGALLGFDEATAFALADDRAGSGAAARPRRS